MMNKRTGRPNIIDVKLLKYGFVGILNTIFSALIMFILYNLAELSYWSASAIAYILGSLLSFFMNKKFTFNNRAPLSKTAVKFTINIIICYLISYSISMPIVKSILLHTNIDTKIIEQISMLFGMILFTFFNYIGQRYFTFKEKVGLK